LFVFRSIFSSRVAEAHKETLKLKIISRFILQEKISISYFSSKFLHCAALSDTAHTINKSISILTDSWRINFGSLWYVHSTAQTIRNEAFGWQSKDFSSKHQNWSMHRVAQYFTPGRKFVRGLNIDKTTCCSTSTHTIGSRIHIARGHDSSMIMIGAGSPRKSPAHMGSIEFIPVCRYVNARVIKIAS
jgi:hypothetical protein